QEHGGRITARTAKLSEAEQEATARDDPERGPVATGRVHVEPRCKPEQEACGTRSEQCRQGAIPSVHVHPSAVRGYRDTTAERGPKGAGSAFELVFQPSEILPVRAAHRGRQYRPGEPREPGRLAPVGQGQPPRVG